MHGTGYYERTSPTDLGLSRLFAFCAACLRRLWAFRRALIRRYEPRMLFRLLLCGNKVVVLHSQPLTLHINRVVAPVESVKKCRGIMHTTLAHHVSICELPANDACSHLGTDRTSKMQRLCPLFISSTVWCARPPPPHPCDDGRMRPSSCRIPNSETALGFLQLGIYPAFTICIVRLNPSTCRLRYGKRDLLFPGAHVVDQRFSRHIE